MVIATLTTSRILFVQLGGYGGLGVVSGLAWSYVPPSHSKTPTRSHSVAKTHTRSRSASRTRKMVLRAV